MKHLIILNGCAGEGEAIKHEKEIKEAFEGLNAEIHYSSAPGEATAFLRERLKTEERPLRVYACGGDGTVYECVNGIIDYPDIELAIFAIGTGNDFVKIYGGQEKFLDLKKIINGTVEEVDLSKIECPELERPIYSINAINVGFSAYVADYGNMYKLKGKDNPYDRGIVPALMKNRKTPVRMIIDGEEMPMKKILMVDICQGKYIGSKFKCAPYSDNKDGLLDISIIPPVTLLTFVSVIKPFTDGVHLENPKTKKHFTTRRAKHIDVYCNRTEVLCVDGETVKGTEFHITALPKALKLVIPQGE